MVLADHLPSFALIFLYYMKFTISQIFVNQTRSEFSASDGQKSFAFMLIYIQIDLLSISIPRQFLF